MAEMLGMLDNPSNPDAALDREALFPGSSCYPVTGAAGNTIVLSHLTCVAGNLYSLFVLLLAAAASSLCFCVTSVT